MAHAAVYWRYSYSVHKTAIWWGNKTLHLAMIRIACLCLVVVQCEVTNDLHDTRSQTDEVITSVPPAHPFLPEPVYMALAGKHGDKHVKA